MKISIQIVNYNSKRHLRECLRTLRKTYSGKVPFEVILINNDSESIAELAKEHDFPFDIVIEEINDNVGFGRAHNKGALAARGEYLFFLNPDTLIPFGFLESMVKALEADPRIGIVGPEIIGEDGLVNEEHCGLKKTPLSLVGKKIIRGGTRGEIGGGISEKDWVSGGALMIRKKLFSELGGFDHNYFMYFEDVDLCLRAKKHGYKIAVDSGTQLVHKSGKSFLSEKAKKRFYYASQDYYFKKNFGILAAVLVRVLRFPIYLKNVYFRK